MSLRTAGAEASVSLENIFQKDTCLLRGSRNDVSIKV